MSFKQDKASTDGRISLAANPKSAKRFQLRSIKSFVAFAGLVMCAQSALAIYSKSVLTSIEKRFEISSSLAGFIVGSFNIGNLLFVVAVSKLSSKRHRPRIMAVGSLLIAFGGFVNFVPHLLTQPYQPSTLLLNSSSANESCSTSEEGSNSSQSYLYVILIVGEILQGIGATVHIPISSSYIDDFALPSRSPIYLGISFVCQNLGPGIGFVIGSWTSTLYVDFDRVPEENITITSDDKAVWIGAWWLGYLVIGAWVTLAAFPLFFFPKTMPHEGSCRTPDDSDVTVASDAQELRTLMNGAPDTVDKPTSLGEKNDVENDQKKKVGFFRDFVDTVIRLLTNSVYVLVILGYSGLMFVTGSLTAFMPKLLEQAFDMSPGYANFLFGVVISPVICFGLLAGGIVVNRMKWGKVKIMRFVVGCGLVALVPLGCTFFISCTPPPSICQTNGTLTETDGTTCNSDCGMAIVFFVITMSMGALMVSTMVTPIYTVVLRSVSPEDKCTAIGVMFFVIRVLGLVPAPIVTGAAIDGTCLNWKQDCGMTKNCIEYDVEQFRYSYLSIIVVGIFVCMIFNLCAYLLVDHQSGGAPGFLCSAATRCRKLLGRDEFPSTETRV